MFFRPRSVQQVATLPFVPRADGIDVLLVTSRHGGRWILPKGWPSGGMSLADAARREAEEEAGVVGLLGEEPIGSYSYRKRMDEGYEVRCAVFVFPLLVHEHRIDWDEKAQRTIRWCGFAEAVRLVEDRGLSRLLADLRRNDAEALYGAFDLPRPAA